MKKKNSHLQNKVTFAEENLINIHHYRIGSKVEELEKTFKPLTELVFTRLLRVVADSCLE